MPPIGASRRQCLICQRTFNKTEHLQRHQRSHTKEKPFQCKNCGRSYSRYDTLLRHQRSHDSVTVDDTAGRPQRNLENGSRSFLSAADAAIQAITVDRGSSNYNDVQMFGEQRLRLPSNTTDPSYFEQDKPVPEATASNYALLGNELGPDHGNSSTAMQLPLSLDDTNIFFDDQVLSWFLQEDLDFGIFTAPSTATMADLPPISAHKSPEVQPIRERTVPNLKQLCFTNLSAPQSSEQASRTATPLAGSSSDMVDDEYRRTLHKRLQPQVSNRQLPSSDFLNLCVRLYFVHVSPVFPIVHAPTFRPMVQNSSLLLSICSVGSLFTGSGNAAEQGIHIFEQLNKAVLAGRTTWDRLIRSEKSEVVPMVQAALIGQTFGLLSGHPKHLAIVDSFHGTVLSWARRIKVFDARQQAVSSDDLAPENLERTWRNWVMNEEVIRLCLALHVHDAELTGILFHEGALRHDARRLPHCASDELFSAPTAKDWASLYRETLRDTNDPVFSAGHVSHQTTFSDYAVLQLIPPTSGFTVYAALEAIAADVIEKRIMEAFDDQEQARLCSLLIKIYQLHIQRSLLTLNDPFGLVVLWHLTFMSLYVDFNLLERAVGRDGPLTPDTDEMSITQWATSKDAKRCVAHASLIYKTLRETRIGVEPAIHVPRAMFLAAIAWYCFIRYGSQSRADHSTADLPDFPEFRIIGANSTALLCEWNGIRREKPRTVTASGTICGLMDLLQHIGHWEIARKFAPILGTLIHQERN